MRTVASVAFSLAALAAIMGLSISSALVEQDRLFDAFAQSTRGEVHAAAEALARVDSLEKDTHMLVDLVNRSRTGRPVDLDTERRVWDSAFRALALVVVPYRVLALVDADGALEVLAVDPTESASTIQTLVPRVRRLGVEVAARRGAVARRPERVAARSFLSYAMAVPGGSAIVVVSDAAQFLTTVAWTPLPAARLFVTDPAGATWAGCETSTGCRASDGPDPLGAAPASRAALSKVDPETAARFGLGRVKAVRASETVDRPAGRWTITWIASSDPITKGEQSLLSRIVLTAAAVAAVIIAVGTVMSREQRRAMALRSELSYAQAQANARQLENQLVRAEKLTTVGVMATEIAHEIGTPLAVIRGRAEQVLRDAASGPRADDLRVVIKHVDGISSTVRQLLDFSRRSPTEQHPVSLELIVERARDLMSWKLQAKRLRLRVDLAADLPLLAADPDQLQQVLVNLLLNAADASAPDGELRVRAAVAAHGMVRIEVVDHGTGIPAELMQEVFEPFFTTKQRGEGTGLGLPIATSIIRRHAGHIALDSTPGKGTTVSLLWPIAERSSDG